MVELDSGVTWERLTSHQHEDVDFLHVIYDVGGSSAPDERLMRHPVASTATCSRALGVQLGFERRARAGRLDRVRLDAAASTGTSATSRSTGSGSSSAATAPSAPLVGASPERDLEPVVGVRLVVERLDLLVAGGPGTARWPPSGPFVSRYHSAAVARGLGLELGEQPPTDPGPRVDDATHMRLSSVGASRWAEARRSRPARLGGWPRASGPGAGATRRRRRRCSPRIEPLREAPVELGEVLAQNRARGSAGSTPDLDHRRRQGRSASRIASTRRSRCATRQFEEGSGGSSLRWSSSARSLTPPAVNAPSAPGGPAR